MRYGFLSTPVFCGALVAALIARGGVLLDLPVDNSPEERSYIVEDSSYYDMGLKCRITDGARKVVYRFGTDGAKVKSLRLEIANSYKVSLSRDGEEWKSVASVDRVIPKLENHGWISIDVNDFLDGAESFLLKSEHYNNGKGGFGGCIFRIVVEGERGERLPRPELEAAKIAADAVAVDGVLGDEIWANAAWAGNFSMRNSSETPSQPTYAAVAYDENNLYFGFKCYDIRVNELEAIEKVRDADVFRDNCVEIFMRPAGATSYWHFAANPAGVQYDSMSSGGEAGDNRAWNAKWKSATSRHPDRWELEIAIPWSELGLRPNVGKAFDVNFTRFAGSFGEMATWVPIHGSFHQPDRFGRVTLGEQGCRYSFGVNHRQLKGNPPRFEFLMQPGRAPAARRSQAVVAFYPSDDRMRFAGTIPSFTAVVDVDPANGTLLRCEPIAAGRYLASVDWKMRGKRMFRQLLPVAISAEDCEALKMELLQPVFQTETALVVMCSSRIVPEVREFEWTINSDVGRIVASGCDCWSNAKSLSLPLPEALGEYTLDIQAKGLPATRRRLVFRREKPLGVPTKFDIDAKGWWRKDGEPFFPLVSYLGGEGNFKAVAKAGFNVDTCGFDGNSSSNTIARNIALLDRARGNGIYINFHLANLFRGKEDYAGLKMLVSSLKNHPALMSWYLADEPSGTATSPTTLKKARDIIHAIDPLHPVVGCDNSPLMYKMFGDCFDAFMGDPYPVPGNPLGQVMQSIDRSFDVSAKGVSVGNVFQGFGAPFVSRAPNEREVRNMTLQGLACGIRMAGWWSFGTMRSSREWPIYSEMVAGCRDVAPFLWGVNPDRRREGDVVFSRFVSRRGTVVIAVNIAESPAKSVMPWSDVPEREVPFGFGVKRDGLSLEIEPYGCALWKTAVDEDPARWVDAFIGTAATGHTTPAACVPFGLVQAGPDTAGRETMWWHYCSGYRHDDDRMCGFSQTHLNGTGGIDLGDLLILPTVESKSKGDSEKLETGFDKSSEVAEPGYYAVELDGGINAEMSATEHAAIYRFRYKKGGAARLHVDLLHGLSLLQHDNGKEVKCISSFDGKSGLCGTISRTGWVPRDVSFALVFDTPYSSGITLPPRKPGEAASRYVFDFDLNGGDVLTVKIGLSAEGGIAAAKRNLAAEISAWDFDAVKVAAHEKWNEVLGRATIEGTDEQKKNWYTSLYHLFIQPNNIADAGKKPFYSTFSCWDTFRAAHPLYTILAPDKAAEFVDSMLEQGRRTGYLPIWTLWGHDNQCMIGTHSIPVIVDWFLKECKVESVKCKVEGKKDYWLAAYAQIKDTLTKPHKGRIKERWDLLDRYGYYPFDIIKGESVSRTMECAYDDWCAGVMAKQLGFKADADFFFKRSEYWKNVFDVSIGLVRGKDSNGCWREPFDPYRLGHGSSRDNDFTEGNAFQYTWHVIHDPDGLIAAMGGRKAFVDRLDSLFVAPSRTDGMGEVLDVTGLIGQYVHGNEPSHHVIYFYPQVGHPEKAAERIREVFDKFYLPKPDGLCGNDDCGQMSAWYIFSAMGFYPFNPCGGEYIIGAPQVACANLKVESGEFKVVARNLSRENKYVKSVTLNGKPITDWKIRHADIMAGGELVFEMTNASEHFGD